MKKPTSLISILLFTALANGCKDKSTDQERISRELEWVKNCVVSLEYETALGTLNGTSIIISDDPNDYVLAGPHHYGDPVIVSNADLNYLSIVNGEITLNHDYEFFVFILENKYPITCP